MNMVEIRPFKATIFNPALEVSKLVCPVYDTIDAANYQKYAREENNIIHVTSRRKDMDRDEFIRNASEEFDRFWKSGILTERENPHSIFTVSYTHFRLKSSPCFLKRTEGAGISCSALWLL